MINQKLNFLMSEENLAIPLSKALRLTSMTNIELVNEIQKVNEIAQQFSLPEIKLNSRVIDIPNQIQKNWLNILFAEKEQEIVYSEKERQEIIYLLVFMENDYYSVFHFQEFLHVSKNTILNDLRKIREQIELYHVRMVYSRKQGFVLKGSEENIRLLAYKCLSNILMSKQGTRLITKAYFTESYSYYQSIRQHLFETIELYNLSVVPSRLDEMVYYVAFLLKRILKHSVKVKKVDQKLLSSLTSYQASVHFLASFKQLKDQQMESYYFTIIIMTILQGEIRDNALEFLLNCASQMIHEVERLTAIEFQNYRKLLLDLFYHLVPAYFRIRFGFFIENVLVDEIKVQYEEMFEITHIALHPLKLLIQENIPETEIAYFTILFGGAISNEKERKKANHLKALILCPNGISSSLIMKSELQELFPQIDFIEVKSIESYYSNGEMQDVDMIFSSIPIQTEKKLYIIHPIMTHIEKSILLRTVQKDFIFPKVYLPSVNEIVDAILPYVDIKKGMTKEKIYHYVQNKLVKDMKRKVDDRPMLSELLTKEYIRISDEKMDWQAAIRQAAKPLLDHEKIEESYIQAMIKKVQDYGAFIHIGKGIALPHARPEDGVNKIGMSLLKVTQPICLLDDPAHEVQLFICLAAVDNETHLRALSSLTKILSNKEYLNQLLQAQTIEEILNVIEKGENE